MKSREIRASEMTKSRVPRETISVLLSLDFPVARTSRNELAKTKGSFASR